MAWNPEFEVAFNPKTVAVAGASRETLFWGDFVLNLQRVGFPGRIYPINPRAADGDIHGLKVYPDLRSVPEPIDLVIVAVPAVAVPTVLEDCIAANAKNVHVFTAGFREIGEEKGIELEGKLREIAKRGGLRILGPNCMGLHIPAARLTTWEMLDPKAGPVAFISQSGGHAGLFVGDGPQFGIHFSKVISFGNAAGLDSLDFLEYLATDPETRIITMYLEGIGDGGRLTRMVREINREKPVIVWKGGLTQWGAKAVASHTGALGGDREIWDAFYRQTGAVRVDSLEELCDVTMTFLGLSPLTSRRIALIGAGGGNSVAGADICAREGLELPTLTPETAKVLRSFIPPEGTIITNPLDIGVVLRDVSVLLRSLEPVAADPLIDSIIFALPVGLLLAALLPQMATTDAKTFVALADREYRSAIDSIIRFARQDVHRKPLMMVPQVGMGLPLPGVRGKTQRDLIAAGIPVYLSLQRATRALSKFIGYHEFHTKASAPQ
jgi:acyl-CoA synthetase (NDP forming)